MLPARRNGAQGDLISGPDQSAILRSSSIYFELKKKKVFVLLGGLSACRSLGRSSHPVWYAKDDHRGALVRHALVRSSEQVQNTSGGHFADYCHSSSATVPLRLTGSRVNRYLWFESVVSYTAVSS